MQLIKATKIKNILIAFLFSISILLSCKKAGNELRPVSSLTVVNATTDIASAKVYAADHIIYWKDLPSTETVAQYRSFKPGVLAGNNYTRAVSNADTMISLFTSAKTEEFKEASFNTLFLAGKSGNYEAVLVNNDAIQNYTDSVIGIRFINLSSNSPSVNITLSTSPTTKEATGLAYKSKSDFKAYPSLYNTAAMVFQVRNAADSLLATYTLPFAGSGTYATSGIANGRFKNITLVVKGLYGTNSGTNAFGVFPVAYY